MKKFCFPDSFEICVTCASGVEKVTKSELNRLGVEDVPVVNGVATFKGDKSLICDCNVNLRTADRVYVKLGEFPVSDFDTLFEQIKAISFEEYIPYGAKIIVNGKSVKSKLFALSAIQSIIKKAIVERLKDKYNSRSFDEYGSEYEVVFSLFKDEMTVLLNTSGAGLHKRGYRDLVGIAPIKETLASSLLLLSDAYYKNPFLDPFCGSGTLAIEGARIALNIASGRDRKFAFNGWENFEDKFYEQAIIKARDNEKLDRKIEFFASDIDKKAVQLATRHAERAGVGRHIKFKVSDVKNVKNELSFGTIVTNPPYGERVYDRKEAEECYKSLGKVVENLDRWSTFVITSHKGFERYFGKRADRVRRLYNSNKECGFYYYYGKRRSLND
jgi:putative N6-adenine-specific DNA methylase